MIKSKYTADCVAALVKNGKGSILGAMKKDMPYLIMEGVEVVTAPTLEDLKTMLTERNVQFSEKLIRPISQ
jgi:hypothetical protein